MYIICTIILWLLYDFHQRLGFEYGQIRVWIRSNYTKHFILILRLENYCESWENYDFKDNIQYDGIYNLTLLKIFVVLSSRFTGKKLKLIRIKTYFYETQVRSFCSVKNVFSPKTCYFCLKIQNTSEAVYVILIQRKIVTVKQINQT